MDPGPIGPGWASGAGLVLAVVAGLALLAVLATGRADGAADDDASVASDRSSGTCDRRPPLVRDRWRGIPRSVRAVTALFGALLLAYSLLTPLGEAPDEAAHADLVLHLATGAPYPNYDGRNLGKAVQFGSSAYRPMPGTRVLTPEDAPDRAERRDFEDFGGDVAGRTPNAILQHPPLYYRITSLAVRAERFLLPGTGLPPLDREWSMLRLISVLMALPLPLIAWATARRIGAADPSRSRRRSYPSPSRNCCTRARRSRTTCCSTCAPRSSRSSWPACCAATGACGPPCSSASRSAPRC